MMCAAKASGQVAPDYPYAHESPGPEHLAGPATGRPPGRRLRDYGSRHRAADITASRPVGALEAMAAAATPVLAAARRAGPR